MSFEQFSVPSTSNTKFAVLELCVTLDYTGGELLLKGKMSHPTILVN